MHEQEWLLQLSDVLHVCYVCMSAHIYVAGSTVYSYIVSNTQTPLQSLIHKYAHTYLHTYSHEQEYVRAGMQNSQSMRSLQPLKSVTAGVS
jgi:hypothetical protein